MEVLESESHRDAADDRCNRLDLKVRNHRGELVLIEVQYGSTGSTTSPATPSTRVPRLGGIRSRCGAAAGTAMPHLPRWARRG
ncbi:hypothetical protein [Candidatus Thiodictyon syntrophicum]|jgi:hypothetical protein|uniref:Uncharacterized protein n=1 Tax=Candidatus Thiodictyon syntrophicum TaxID=1166950 RepID=A0A2K8U9X0_9GAMM|nr:hypothetical protein [Candidatus Thiodictyon syntrophicum]AUB82380.1 hypothetical protein THSYN_16470 [Candidatus Thiodictyon syntrophicum]